MILISHPTGNQNLRQVLRTLREGGLLNSFHTTIGLAEDQTPPLPGKLGRAFEKRRYSVSKEQLHTSPWRELVRTLLINHQGNPLVRHESGPCSVDGVYHALDRKLAGYLSKHHGALTAVYGYEDGCKEHFHIARRLGVKTLYELPIAFGPYAQEVLREEAVRWPEWEPTLISTRDSAQKMKRKREELDLADVIIVPGSFVENSIPKSLREGKPVWRLPYGIETPEATLPQRESGAPLRFLYAGALTQRKGLADLFAAWKLARLESAELHVLGSPLMPLIFYQEQCLDAIFHQPRPRDEVLAMMDCCDVLVLPSLIEGRALVQLEAIGRGLPLLITPNTGGEDLIREGETGWIVPIRDAEALADRLQWFSEHRARLPQMREACLAMAQTKSWAAYRSKLAQALQTLSLSNEDG
ncbi:MAG: glycosyltransferase family 4 protein [Verrucomicrobiota bacterium]